MRTTLRDVLPIGGPLGLGKVDQRDRYRVGSVSMSFGTSIPGQEGLILASTCDKEAGIAKIFDAERVQQDVTAQTQTTQTFTMLAPKQVAAYAAGKVRQLKEQLGQRTDPQRRAQLQQEGGYRVDGGRYRVASKRIRM